MGLFLFSLASLVLILVLLFSLWFFFLVYFYHPFLCSLSQSLHSVLPFVIKNFSLKSLLQISLMFFVESHGPWCLTSAPFHCTFPLLSTVHLQSPLTSHCRPPPPLCSTRFLLCSPSPTSTHVHSCILHLHHHIRPVLFLHSSLIYIPPSPSLFYPPTSLPIPFLPLCFALSGSLSAPKKRFTPHWALWYHLSSPLFWVQALEQTLHLHCRSCWKQVNVNTFDRCEWMSWSDQCLHLSAHACHCSLLSMHW